MADNTLYYGDNLDILQRYVKDESVDLIYLDPPWNSKATYNVLFARKNGTQSPAQIKAFEDTWHWDAAAAAAFEEVVERGGDVSRVMQAFRTFLGENDMLAYLSMMAPRLIELHRTLKKTGSIYLHCDPVASHYLKILMDAVFGPTRFRSEIVWRRSAAHNKISRQYGPIHDIILFYSKGDDIEFHPGRTPYVKSYIEGRFTKSDGGGRYRSNELTGSGVRGGSSGQPWRGFDPTPKGRHWAIPATLREFLPDDGKGMTSQEKLDFLADLPDGHIEIPEDEEGWPTYKQYIGPGVPYQDIWAYQPGTREVLYGTDECIDEDVRWLESEAERLGYPTQKPEGLLDRILETSSNEGDLVLDPFCGCGTTIAVAQRLNRQWIGIDITHLAVGLMKLRLRDTFGDKVVEEYEVIGEPKDFGGAKALAEEDRHQFQAWALGLVDARREDPKKGADRGIDGRLYFHDDPKGGKTKQIILSVKSGGVSVGDVRDLWGVVEREKAEIGVLITLQKPTKPMRTEAASSGFYDSPWGKHPRLQVLTIAELLDGKGIDYPPTRQVNVTFKKAPRAKVDAAEAIPLFEKNGDS